MTFFPRAVNNIKIDFTEKELCLLSRGFKIQLKNPRVGLKF
jgi:hypothetical protein